jgi:tagatose 6-phosphate kinase
MIITVTLNAAIDRTLVVPNFKLGRRHRAVEQTAMAGGKGVNVARALKALGQPVIATGVAGGPTGTRIIEHLTSEAILADFLRISEESRTSTAVADPTSGEQTEINERGPKVTGAELELFVDKLLYLAKGAEVCVFAGSLPRGVDVSLYARLVAELRNLGVTSVLDSEGEPLRLGVQAEPLLVSPNEREAEALVGQEFNDDDDYLTGLETIAELGARNVLITLESGCWALLRNEREPTRYRAAAPKVDPLSAVGSGDVLLAAFVAARLDGRSDEEALRAAVAAGAASTLEIGAGRFEPRESGRLIGSVEVAQLEPVGSE